MTGKLLTRVKNIFGIADVEVPQEPVTVEVEKALVYAMPDSHHYFVMSEDNKNIVDLGYDVPDGCEEVKDSEDTDEDEGEDVVSTPASKSYRIFSMRGYADMRIEDLPADANFPTVAAKALDLIENAQNNITGVVVVSATKFTFAGRPLYESALTLRYVEKSQKRSEEEEVEKFMPYRSVADLPSGVKSLPEKRQRQWMEVFNSAYNKCRKEGGSDCDASAARQAWGVVKKSALDEDALTETPYNIEFSLVKSALEKGLVYGIVYAPNTKDSHDDFTSADVIEKAAHDFLPEALKNGDASWTDVNHRDAIRDVEVVESFIAPCDFSYAPGDVVKKGSWVLVARVNNPALRDAILKGELTGFSLEGTAIKIG